MNHLTLPGRQRGVVLVVVLWVITLLSIMAASFSYSSRTETALASHGLERAKARMLALAGLEYGVLRIIHATARPPEEALDPATHWEADGQPRQWAFGDGEVSITMRDTSGQIDLNQADRQLLGGLLQEAGGVGEEEVDVYLDLIEDFRDPDDLSRLNGAEDSDYEAAGLAFGPKNSPFESVEELQQVMGVSAALYQRVAPYLTVYSNQPGINPAMAEAPALYAVPGIDRSVIDEYLQMRQSNRAAGLPLPQPPPLGAYLSQGRGFAYHAEITGRLDSGASAYIETTITRGRRAGELYHPLTWREAK